MRACVTGLCWPLLHLAAAAAAVRWCGSVPRACGGRTARGVTFKGGRRGTPRNTAGMETRASRQAPRLQACHVRTAVSHAQRQLPAVCGIAEARLACESVYDHSKDGFFSFLRNARCRACVAAPPRALTARLVAAAQGWLQPAARAASDRPNLSIRARLDERLRLKHLVRRDAVLLAAPPLAGHQLAQ
jgi:hypothetical protein